MRRLLQTTVLIAIWLCETTAAGRQASPSVPKPAAQAPAFRAGVDVVSLSVTVTDGMNHYVADLEPGEFSVFEDEINRTSPSSTAVSSQSRFPFLLDSSASMEERLPTLHIAATNFVKRLRPNDIAQVIDFDSRVETRQAFTSNQSELESAIQQTIAGGSTSLYSAIYVGVPGAWEGACRRGTGRAPSGAHRVHRR